MMGKMRRAYLNYSNVKLAIFTAAFVVIGITALLITRAAVPSTAIEAEQGRPGGNAQQVYGDSTASGTGYVRFNNLPPSGAVKFRLFAPGWRPMASGQAAAIAKADIFKEIIDGTYYDPSESDPKLRQKAIKPADLQAKGAKVYNYTLGPYVTNRYVPCDLIPSTHPDYNDYVVDTPTCLDETGARARPSDLNFTGFSFSEWRKAIALAKYNDSSNPHSTACPVDPVGATLLSVYACRFDNNFLIYPNSLPWITYMNEQLIPNALKFGTNTSAYDGVFADSVGSNPADSIADNTVRYLNHTPLKPRNNNAVPILSDPMYDHSSWLSASAESVLARKQKLDSLNKVLTLNGLETGDEYWAGCDLSQVISATCSILGNSNRKLLRLDPANLAQKPHGAMSEAIFRAAGAGINSWNSNVPGKDPYVDRWLKDVEMIRDVQARGIKGYWWTKCWTGTDYSCDDENPALVTQWRRFVIASYLLGAGDKSYFNWDEKRDDNNSAQYFTADYDHATAVGSTNNTNNYSQIGTTGVYMRCFSKGLVLVNPKQTAQTITIPTPGNYTKFGATSESNITSLDLPAHTGELLVKSTTQSCS